VPRQLGAYMATYVPRELGIYMATYGIHTEHPVSQLFIFFIVVDVFVISCAGNKKLLTIMCWYAVKTTLSINTDFEAS